MKELPCHMRFGRCHSLGISKRMQFYLHPACGEGSEQQEGIVLQNLHTLEVAVNLRLTEEVCKRMPNLKKLKVLYNHFRDDYYLHNLVRFNKLKSLEISLFGGSKWCDVAPSLTFPPSLEELELRDCHLGWEDLTVLSSSLPHLGSLRVSHVPGSEWNLDEEEFCCLKTLMIEQCHDLTYLNANSSNFPVLKSLVLCIVPKLSEIPLDIGEIPTLGIIHLTGCGASAAFSAARIVAEQEANGNHDIQTHLHFWDHKPEEFERFQEMLLREECLTSNSIHLYYGGKKFKAF